MSLTSVCAVEKWWRMAYFWLRKGGPFSWSYANLRRRSRRIPLEAGMGLLNILGGLGFQRPQASPEGLQLLPGHHPEHEEERCISQARCGEGDPRLQPPREMQRRLHPEDDAHEDHRREQGAHPGSPWHVYPDEAAD